MKHRLSKTTREILLPALIGAMVMLATIAADPFGLIHHPTCPTEAC